MIRWLLYLGWLFGPLVSWFFFKWMPEHPQYAEKLLYYIWQLIPFAISYKKRQIIEKEIHGFISEEIDSINKEAYGCPILPKGIKVEWTLKKEEEVIIEENEVVIRLGSRIEACENFVDALTLYLSASFMPNARIYLDEALYNACKFQTAISMLKKRKDEYYRVFMNKYYKPSLEKYKGILNYSEKLESIENSGLFISCLLPIFSFYIDRWIFLRKAPSPKIQQEIDALLDFIHNIATKEEYKKEVGEKPPIDYQGTYFKVSIIPVAREELSTQLDYRPHVEKAKQKLRYSADILFIMGRGRNIALAEMASMKLKCENFCEQIDGVSKFYFYPVPNKKIDGVCYAFKRKTY